MNTSNASSSITPKQQKLALWGLILVAVAPSISVITGFAFKAGIIAILVFVITKTWMFGLPAIWYLKVEKGDFSFSLPRNGGWGFSALLGVLMALVIFLAYFLLGEKLLNSQDLFDILDPVGLTNSRNLALAIIFWVFVNSVLEEYVFRWFVTSKLELLFDGQWLPIFLSAGIFTIHHTIALAFFIDPLGNLLASLGVFIGGSIFSWIYIRYRSIWVAWVAHAIADIAIFTIAWHLIIGF